MSILINDNTARVQYVATSGQTSFTVPFEFFVNSDLKVYKNGTLLTITTHYTVTGAGVTGGGSITLVTGATAGDIVTVVRDIPVKRITDFPLSGPFNISALNTQLDQLTAMIQEADTAIKGRVVALADSDIPNALTAIPLKDVRANSLFWWDDNGQPSVIGGSDLATVVAFGNSVADTYTGNGTTTTFTLSENPGSVNNLLVSIDGAVKVPVVDYNWTVGTTITFTTAPGAGEEILIRYSRALTEAAPIADGAVTTAKIADGAVTIPKGGTGTTTAFTAGSLVFAGASGVYSQNNSKLFWDNTNSYLGVGTNSPNAVLHLNKATGGADLRFSVAGTLYCNMYASSSDVNIYTVTSIPLIFGTNNSERFRISSTGSITSSALPDAVGYKGVPQSGTTTTAVIGDVGKCIRITSNIAIPNGVFAQGDAISIYNAGSGPLSITQGTGFTLRLAGTATTGNRSIARYGIATIWFDASNEGVISGPGVS